jgi:hypothetical protein
VQKLSYRSFRGSVSGLGFAYCDFYQRNPRTELLTKRVDDPRPAAIPIANSRPVLRPSLAE